MFKRFIRALLLGICWPFRPLVLLFCWWMPLKLARIHNAVLLPDSMAVLFVVVGGISLVPFFGLKLSYIPACIVVFLFSPLVLLNLVHVRGPEVFVYRLIAFLPYWRHRIPVDAKFDFFEAWEDPAPTGVAFEADSYKNDPLHLGTAESAEPLFLYLGGLLESQGWQKESFSYKRPVDQGLGQFR
jgi:hypothetical protein